MCEPVRVNISATTGERQRHWSDCAYHGSRRSSFYIWAWARQHKQNDVRSTKTQGCLGIRPVGHPPSLIRAWVANDLNFCQSDSEDSGQIGRIWRLRWAHRSFVGFVGLRIISLLNQPRYSWLQAHRMNIVAFEFHSFEWVHCNWIKYQILPHPRNENKNTATPHQYDKIFEI